MFFSGLCVATAEGCQAIRDERLSSGLIGAYIPDCAEEGLYKPTQCHGSTGFCWCVNEIGEEILETRRGPGEERIDCEGMLLVSKILLLSRNGILLIFGWNSDFGTLEKKKIFLFLLTLNH